MIASTWLTFNILPVLVRTLYLDHQIYDIMRSVNNLFAASNISQTVGCHKLLRLILKTLLQKVAFSVKKTLVSKKFDYRPHGLRKSVLGSRLKHTTPARVFPRVFAGTPAGVVCFL